jgi:hypothetical protein
MSIDCSIIDHLLNYYTAHLLSPIALALYYGQGPHYVLSLEQHG